MSYGWLTESALLPTRAVPIRGVSDTSLLSLSNHIISLQQEQQEQQQQHGFQPLAAGATQHKYRGETGLGAATVGIKRSKPLSQSFKGGTGDWPICSSRGDIDAHDKDASKRAVDHGRRAEEEKKKDDVRGDSSESVQRSRGRRRVKLLLSAQEKNQVPDVDSSKNHQGDTESLYVLRRTSRKTWKRPSCKPKTREELLLDGKNARVEERAAKDEVHYKALQKTLEASRRRLEEKAKLYDELVSGRLHRSRAPAGASLVVDFEEKLWRSSSASALPLSGTHTTDMQKATVLKRADAEEGVNLLAQYFSAEETER